MPKIERKMLNLEVDKQVLTKENVEMKSTLEAKEDMIMTKRKDVLLREAPKTTVHANLAMTSNSTNAQVAKEQIERRKNNVVIRSMQEDQSNNALSLKKNMKNSLKIVLLREMVPYMPHIGLVRNG